MIRVPISAVVIAILLGVTYSVSRASLRIFSLGDPAARDANGMVDGHRRFWDVFSLDTREVLFAAELFNSLVFVGMIVVVIWSCGAWAATFGLPVRLCAVLGLALVWLARVFLTDVLPRRVTAENVLEREGRPSLPGLALLHWVFRPIVVIAGRLSRWRGREIEPPEREEIVERAIDSLAESAGMDEPVIEPGERAMIQGVIRLEDTEVREVMVPRIDIVAIDVRTPVDDVRRRIADSGHSRFPVYDGDLDTIVGVLYIKDLFCAEGSGALDLGRLARRAFVVPETKKVDALLEEFKRNKVHIALVVDEFGGTAGLVTLEDILEEIVGEIEDEHERQSRLIEWVDDHTIHADGVVSLADIADLFEIELPDERFETIGGLIYDRVGGIPQVGQSIEVHGLIFTIEQMDGQRIRRVNITRRVPASPPHS